MSGYRYEEPENNFKPLVGEYDFRVIEVGDTYTKENGNFVLPVRIEVEGPNGRTTKIYDNPSAGRSKKGERYDTIAPFLKAIRRNPASGEEPDFSSRNLVGCRGVVKLKAGDDGYSKVHYYIYEDGKATTSRGADAPPRTYDQPAADGQQPNDDFPF